MGVLMQAYYKQNQDKGVPSPFDGDAGAEAWWDHIARQANALRAVGFSALWLPPVQKAASGVQSVGFDLFDDYDLGSKNQKASVPTRYGTREQLQRCVATLRANGLDVYLDLVEHQRDGDTTPFVYQYVGANGVPNTGRFPKGPLCFHPNAPRDPGVVDASLTFGRDLATVTGQLDASHPAGSVGDALIAAAEWLVNALDIQGLRIDDAKGVSTVFLNKLLDSPAGQGKFSVGEFFDGNIDLVKNWIFNPNAMNGRVSAFDFPLKFTLSAMCNQFGAFDMSLLDHAGLAGVAPLQAVTFVENHDTDNNPLLSPVVRNKMMGYAYILTSEGYPCVYYRDYSPDPGCYGLKPEIDNLIWIHEKLANGPTQQRWKEQELFAYERLGAPNLLVGLNNSGVPRTITVDTGFGPNTSLHDYTGHANDLTTDGAGRATLTLPPNHNGNGYVCYSRQGIDGGFTLPRHPVTQTFEGAPDLDIGPATVGAFGAIGRIWADADTTIHTTLNFVPTGWTPQTTLTLAIDNPDGTPLAARTYTQALAAQANLSAMAATAGWYSLRLRADNVPVDNAPADNAPADNAPNPQADLTYRLVVTYTAPVGEEIAMPPAVPAPLAVNPQGVWGPVIPMPNVPIHTHVLPNGKVLFWGRRDTPALTLNEHACTPQVWDPATNTFTPTPQPKMADGTTVNLFCSGHTFLPDGRLLVVGGHWLDGQGLDQACIYDSAANTWTAIDRMNNGRWYPSALTLSDGSVFALSGSFAGPGGNVVNNDVPQIWNNGPWDARVNFIGLQLFPRLHLAPDGRIFMSGPLTQSYLLDTTQPAGVGAWTPVAMRDNNLRDYAPSIMYAPGKVIFIGGGNNPGTNQPTNLCETIDLTQPAQRWQPTGAMHFARRQHNAVILPDGTVLVVGGTQGGGGANPGFNDLTPGQPVHTAELWDPATGQFILMEAEQNDRCYHSTAVLLPDATVLSAGGGEYFPIEATQKDNDPKDSHRDGQIFSPPYLFRGPRPTITSAPTDVTYNSTFEVEINESDQITQVTWIRLPSVTHSCDQNQRINFLTFKASATSLTITAPPNADLCPPGHYMLFVLNALKVPSVAKIIRIHAPVAQAAMAHTLAHTMGRALAFSAPSIGIAARNKEIDTAAKGTHVVVGLTGTCPYGIAACWGGAYEGLQRLEGAAWIRPVPNAVDSTADVYLADDGLPNLDAWPAQFRSAVNGSYRFRGVEVTLRGSVEENEGQLVLMSTDARPALTLLPIREGEQIQWNHSAGHLRPLAPKERNAYKRLQKLLDSAQGEEAAVQVIGSLQKTETGFTLAVRDFKV